jgi:hypothetical protein
MAEPRITYVPRPDATPQSEISALANAYKFILQCGEEKRATSENSGEEYARKEQHHASQN